MQTFSIVGMKHQGTEEIVAALKPGADLMLVREPENQFDKFAIGVWVDGRRIGYLPGKNNKGLADRIDAHGQDWTPPADSPTMAMDTAPTMLGLSMPATFMRSPNSGYPQAVVS